MTKQLTIGLVVPFSTDRVPDEGPMMYPGVKFIPRAVGVRALTPEGYDAAWNAILPAAKSLAKEGVDAIMVIGTSLTFYRGYEAHQQLLEQLRRETGLPVSTMTEAVVDGLKSVGAKRIAVATAYADEVNNRLADFLRLSGFEVLALRGFGLFGFAAIGLPVAIVGIATIVIATRFLLPDRKPLTEQAKSSNRTKSSVRARVEHVFGAQTNDMGGTLVRTIGMVRAKAKIGMKNLAYNMRRLGQLSRLNPCPG